MSQNSSSLSLFRSFCVMDRVHVSKIEPILSFANVSGSVNDVSGGLRGTGVFLVCFRVVRKLTAF